MLKRYIALVAVLVAIVGGALLAPRPTLSIAVGEASNSYSVRAQDQQVVCPGPLIRSGGDSGTKLGVFDRLGTASLQASLKTEEAGNFRMSLIGTKKSSSVELNGARVSISEQLGNAANLTLATEGGEQGSFAMSASQTQLAISDSLRGLAAATCQAPSNEFWLVGGSTATGRETLLILDNPAPIDAVADLRVFTDLGEVKVSGLSGISVTANSSVVIPLASFAPAAAGLTVQVQSQGAKLAGFLQHKVVRGTSAQGVDLVTPHPAPATELAIPGLVFTGTKQLAKLVASGAEFADAAPAIRLFAPEGAEVSVQVISSDPEVFGSVFNAVIEAGMVTDLPIEDLADGSYSVFVTASSKVFASVRASRAQSDGSLRTDFAWLQPSELITSPRVVTVGQDGEITLMLANPGSTEAIASVTNLATGERSQYSLGETTTIALAISGSFLIESADGVYAATTVLRDGGLASISVTDPKNLGSRIKINFF